MNNWEIAFLILGIIFAISALVAIVLLLVFGTTRDRRKDADVQEEIGQQAASHQDPQV
jgi:hypothetical protein